MCGYGEDWGGEGEVVEDGEEFGGFAGVGYEEYCVGL